ncbi:MAG: ABC transporter transmembrane domain-containing protein [Gammaproteobacteria bacterium]|nr:ABC transporter transmembrane domain-containing protein [Gammaproteobacteria bacterium]
MNAAALPEILRRGRVARTPLVMQAEQHECALACLAMVAGYHGRGPDLPALRVMGGDGGRGAGLRDLMQLAEGMGMHARPLRLEPGELRRLRTPAILHWDLDHFVVLDGAGWRGVTVLDPARGRRRLSLAEAGEHLTGVALELIPGPDFERGGPAPRMRIRDFWSHSTGILRNLVGVLVLSLVLQLLALAAPFHLQLVVDEALVKHDALLLQVLVLGFGAVALLRVAVSWVRGRLVLHAGEAAGFQMASNLLHHLLRLPLPWFERRHLGDVVSRFGSLAPVRELLTEGFAVTVVDGFMAVTTLIMMFFYSATLTGVVLAALTGYALVRLATLPALRRRQQAAIVAAADEETVFLETLRCVETLKAFGREQGSARPLAEPACPHGQRAGAGGAALALHLEAVNGALFGIENLLVIWLGALMVLENSFTVGMLYAFISFKGQFTDRMITLLDGAANLAVLRLHLERLAEIGQQQPETEPVRGRTGTEGARRTGVGRAGIRLRHPAAAAAGRIERAASGRQSDPADRPLRLRQDHAAAADVGAAGPGPGRAAHRRPAAGGARAGCLASAHGGGIAGRPPAHRHSGGEPRLLRSVAGHGLAAGVRPCHRVRCPGGRTAPGLADARRRRGRRPVRWTAPATAAGTGPLRTPGRPVRRRGDCPSGCGCGLPAGRPDRRAVDDPGGGESRAGAPAAGGSASGFRRSRRCPGPAWGLSLGHHA